MPKYGHVSPPIRCPRHVARALGKPSTRARASPGPRAERPRSFASSREARCGTSKPQRQDGLRAGPLRMQWQQRFDADWLLLRSGPDGHRSRHGRAGEEGCLQGGDPVLVCTAVDHSAADPQQMLPPDSEVAALSAVFTAASGGTRVKRRRVQEGRQAAARGGSGWSSVDSSLGYLRIRRPLQCQLQRFQWLRVLAADWNISASTGRFPTIEGLLVASCSACSRPWRHQPAKTAAALMNAVGLRAGRLWCCIGPSAGHNRRLEYLGFHWAVADD